jgi:tRNA(His) guanylyltransferase
MNQNEFESRMRAGEAFHSLQVPQGVWTVLRLDGRGFSRFTKQHFEKPFDARFHELMRHTAQAVMREWEGLYAYTESDEISLLLPLTWTHFDREVEKLVSLSAATASVAFSLAFGQAAHFDCRIWIGDSEEVLDYFRWRQSDALRCALNGWCYWTLRGKGLRVQSATEALEKQSLGQKIALLLEHGIEFEELPAWQRLGVGLYWENYQKAGVNPLSGQSVVATRRRVAVNEKLPISDDYARWLTSLMTGP